MDINLRGHVVIFDEAHNLDDCCREAASYKLYENTLAQAIKECSELQRLMNSEFSLVI